MPKITLDEALAKLPRPDGKRFADMLHHGTLDVEIYAPRGADPQQPHSRDELYVVMSGRATVFVEGGSRPVVAGSVVFVGAGVEHRFLDIEERLVLLVVFGPAEYSRGSG